MSSGITPYHSVLGARLGAGWGRDWGRFSGEIRNSTAELCACILRISGSFSKLAESCWSIFCLPSLRFGVELYVQYHSFESYVFEVNGCYSENRSEKCRSTPAAGGADMRAANHPGAGRLDSRPVYPYRRSPKRSRRPLDLQRASCTALSAGRVAR